MTRIDIELMKTIEPPPWRRMCGTTAWVSCSEPKTLTSNTLRHSARSASANERLDAALEGVVDQHVDAAELGDGGVDEALAVLGAGDVGRYRQRAAAEGAHLGRDRRQLVGAARRQRDVGALARQGEGDVAPHAGADAGDDGDAVLEQHEVSCLRIFTAEAQRRGGRLLAGALRVSAPLR